MGLRVGEVFGGDPAHVRAWLTRGCERMDGPPSQSGTSDRSSRREHARSRRHRQLRDREPDRPQRPPCLARPGPSRRRSGVQCAAGRQRPAERLHGSRRRGRARKASSATCPTPRSSRRRSKAAAARCASSTSRRASAASAAISGRRCWCAGSSRSPAGRGSRSALRPTFNYGALKAATTSGSNHIRYRQRRRRCCGSPPTARSPRILHEQEFSLDRPITMLVGADESVPENPDTLGAHLPRPRPMAYWQTWVRDLNIPFDWQAAVIRAAITLKLCSFEDTGAVLAALTTSVPEAAGTRAQLGLPLLLAARFVLHGDRAQPPVGDQDHGRLRALHRRHRRGRQLARRGRQDRAAVPDRAGHRHRRAADRHAAGLSRLRPGAHRQCRRQPAPERHLWLDGDDGGADVLGRAPAAPGRHGALPPALRGRERSPQGGVDARMRASGNTASARRSIPSRLACAGPPSTGSA